MTNKKGIKRSLLMSALALLLCVSMLIGSTFAWFTDSVTSAGNIIKSGTLKVSMEWKDATATGEQLTYKNAAAGPIFNYDKWEPGYVEAKNVKIENKGTLALKYQLNILPTAEVSELADVIDVYFAEGEITLANREITELKRVGTLREVLAGMPANMSGDLEAEKNDTVTIALKMREDAGNEYQGMSIGSKFAIQLLATQLTYEDDSFDDLYDEDATMGTYIELPAGADLLAAMASAKEDMPLTIKLNGNVEWPTEGHHGENDVTPASSILIDGNGYTITATGAGVTPLGDNNAPMTLKNVKIVDKSVSYKEDSWEFTYLEMGGSSLTCYNVTFADEIQIGTNATFTNCSFESNEESVYAVWVEDGSAAFTNCTFTGYRGLKAHEEYGSEISAVIVKDCVFSNLTKKPGIALGRICMSGDTYTTGATTYTNTTDTTVSITGSTFINCQAGDQGLYIYETDTDVANFNFKEENNTVLNNATIVSTKDDLLALSAKALTGNNGTAEEATIVIGADIDMQGAEFSAIIAQRGDKLTVVGNGHKISNVKVVSGANDNTTGQASMFYTFPNSTLTVSNLVLEDITVTAEENASGYAAAVVGYCEGAVILNNVDVVNATVTGVKSSGMLAGHMSGSLVATDCDISGTVTLADFAEETAGHYAGKYVGTLAGAAELTNCTANVTVSGNLNAANSGDVYGRATAAGSIKINGVAYVAPIKVSDAASLSDALANGKDAVLTGDVETESATTAPYGNKYAFKQDGGVLDGNGYELYMECYGDDYGVMTSGGTVKNIIIKEACRAIMIMYPTQDVILDNVQIGGDGVLYPINTGEAGADGVDLIVTNSTLAGWTSYSNIASASFTNVKFEQGTYYNNIYGRVLKPYVNTTMTDCSFTEHMNLDLSGLAEGQKVTMNNCTVNGTAVTLDVFSIPADNAEYDTELFTVDLPSWATSVADCIVIG